MEIINLTSEQIDEALKLKEDLLEAQSICLFAVETEDNQLAKQQIDISSKRKDLKDSMMKANQTIRKLKLEIKQLERQKWVALRNERGY